MYKLGPIPANDNDFLQVVETGSKQVGDYKWQKIEQTAGESNPNENNIDQSTNTETDNKTENKKDYNKD
jgi:hypothetical protein